MGPRPGPEPGAAYGAGPPGLLGPSLSKQERLSKGDPTVTPSPGGVGLRFTSRQVIDRRKAEDDIRSLWTENLTPP
ncbi:hypothetical protein GCM10009799_03470 [Nocardiopsis rhodophaea]|uniref:Uncharacterized protein n=1 Tax=Nocardiopsis rhodophaea TaxID=280238 RepID=A0ABN2S7Y4_9ACTN